MMHVNKTISFKKYLRMAAMCTILSFPLVATASLLPFEEPVPSKTADKCQGLSMAEVPSGCYYPCKNPYKLKDGTQCCGDTEWLKMPEEYTRPEKNDACYDTDAILAADGAYCYKQTPSATQCPEGFVWNDFKASYDKAQNYCACAAVKCPQGSSISQKKGCYTYRDSGQKSGKHTCWISVPLNDKCPEGQTKYPENCAYGYVDGITTECGSQCYKCNEPDNHCPAGQVKDFTDCLYGYTHGGRTQAGSQCYACKAPTCAFFALVDECIEGCHDSISTTCTAITPKGTPLHCYEKITQSCPQGCDGKSCAAKKCEDFGYTDNCTTGCTNGVRVTCNAQDPGYGLRCFEKIEEVCAQGCDGNSCNIRTCEDGGYVKNCIEGCSGNLNVNCRPVDYYGLLCYERQIENCAQGCTTDGTACNRMTCADGGYVDSCGGGCIEGISTICTPQKYYGLDCFDKQTVACSQGCDIDGSGCNTKTCADGGYVSECKPGCADNTKTSCKRVDYHGLTCYEKQVATCTQRCATDGLTCMVKTCEDGGFVSECKSGCRNGVLTDCKEVEYYGLTCYEKQTTACKQGCAPDKFSCNIKTCADGGYVERCSAGCVGNAKTICTKVEYYGLTCYDRQVENCAQSCASDGISCNDKTCSDFTDVDGTRLTDTCNSGCAENTLINCKAANPGYGLTCYAKTVVQCENGCDDMDMCRLCPPEYSIKKTSQCYHMVAGIDGKTACYKATPCCANAKRTYSVDKPLPEAGFDIVEAQGSQGGYCAKIKNCPLPEKVSCENQISDKQCILCHNTGNYSGSTQCQRVVRVSNECPSGQTKNSADCVNGYVLGNKTACGTQCYTCNLCPSGFATRTGAKCYYSETGADGRTMCYQNIECCADAGRTYTAIRPYPEKGYDIVNAQGSQGGYCYKNADCPEEETTECEEKIIETQCVACQKTEHYSGSAQCQKKVVKSNVCAKGQTKDIQECKYGYNLGEKTACGEQCYSCKICPSGYSSGTTATCYDTTIGLDGVTACYKEVKCCFSEDRAFGSSIPEPAERFEISRAKGAQGGYCYKVKK